MIEYRGLDKLIAYITGLGDPDFGPLMTQWEDVITEGNRRGVLAGVDGHDRPMTPLKCRNGAGIAPRKRLRNLFGTTTHPANNSPSTRTGKDYRTATGPRLAPFRDQSRVITNLHTGHGRDANGTWFAEGAWFNVLSKKGFPFLLAHFNGTNRLPKYDLRPIRRDDLARMKAELRTYLVNMLKNAK